RKQHAALVLPGGVPLPCIVRSDINHAVTHDRSAECLVAKLDAPNDVPAGARVPIKGKIREFVLVARHFFPFLRFLRKSLSFPANANSAPRRLDAWRKGRSRRRWSLRRSDSAHCQFNRSLQRRLVSQVP